VLAIAAVVFALAGPRPATAETPPETLVLVLDGDVTTTAKESPDETRFVRQVALAKAHVRAHRRGPVAVVLAAAAPQVAAAPTDDRDAAIAALGRLSPAPGTADLAPSIRVAVELARRSDRARVLVVSSRALPGVPQDENPVPIEAVGAGVASDDQGLVDQAISRAADGIRTQARFVVRNFAAEPRTRRLELHYEGLWSPEAWMPRFVLTSREVSIPARGEADVVFDLGPPSLDEDFLVGELAGDDSFPGNDRTVAWIPPPSRPSVLVVHGGVVRPFVAAVLDALGESIDREKSGAVLATDFAKAEPRDVTVVDGAPVEGLRGPTLLLAPFGAKGLPFGVGRTVAKPLVWRVEESHPLLRGADLSTAFVASATSIEGKDVRGLAFAEAVAVVAEGDVDGVPWIAFGMDPEGSDLPLRAALPVLLKNAIRILGERPAQTLRSFYRAGEPIRTRDGTSLLSRFLLGGNSPPGVTFIPLIAGPPDPLWHPLEGSSVEPMAPAGGPFKTLVEFLVGSARTATVDLDPARDVAPVRPPSPAPPPAPVETDVASTWRLALLAVAALLLVLDVVLVRAARRKVGATPVPA
jgi:hypothetical protein